MTLQKITILGSTGSIGCSTLDVVRHNPELYTVTALVAGKNVQRMVEQCLEFAPRYAVMDDEGFLRIVDRKKDMILVSGFNVYPNEIEDVVMQHPGVQEVAAVGVPSAAAVKR